LAARQVVGELTLAGTRQIAAVLQRSGAIPYRFQILLSPLMEILPICRHLQLPLPQAQSRITAARLRSAKHYLGAKLSARF
jgi:hypothetical protein